MKRKPGIFLCGLGILLAAGLITGCSSTSNTSTSATSSITTSSASGVLFANDIQTIFNLNCVICHQGANAPAGLNLAVNSAYKNLVNVKSNESPLMRVSPGAPDKSYLLNKLLGTQGNAGGSGAQMPYGAPPLSQAQITLIQQWISQGAPNN
jgi:hypothetical protein